MSRWCKYLRNRDKPLVRFIAVVVLILGLITCFYSRLTAWTGSDMVWIVVAGIVFIAGRISLFLYRTSRGSKDGLLEKRPWWDVL